VPAAGHPLRAPVHIARHSFGGSVALKAASLLGSSPLVLQPCGPRFPNVRMGARSVDGDGRPGFKIEVNEIARRARRGPVARCRVWPATPGPAVWAACRRAGAASTIRRCAPQPACTSVRTASAPHPARRTSGCLSVFVDSSKTMAAHRERPATVVLAPKPRDNKTGRRLSHASAGGVRLRVGHKQPDDAVAWMVADTPSTIVGCV
jgi:hypothetical protein